MYTILFEWPAWMQIERLSQEVQARILAAIEGLATDPEPPGARLLGGEGRRLRIRIGAYRFIYAVDRGGERVVILAVGHRRDIYRRT